MSVTKALVGKRFIEALFHQGNAGNAKHAAELSFDKYVAWNFENVFCVLHLIVCIIFYFFLNATHCLPLN